MFAQTSSTSSSAGARRSPDQRLRRSYPPDHCPSGPVTATRLRNAPPDTAPRKSYPRRSASPRSASQRIAIRSSVAVTTPGQ